MQGKEMGKWDITSGKWTPDAEATKGLTVTEDMRCACLGDTAPRAAPTLCTPVHALAQYTLPLPPPPPHRFYSITAPLDKPATSKGKDLVIQLSAKIENHQYAFCGGGYIKLLPAGTKPETFGGNDEYHIMFGPDLCGYDVSHIHLIFNNKVRRRAGCPPGAPASLCSCVGLRCGCGFSQGPVSGNRPLHAWRRPRLRRCGRHDVL